VVPPPDGDGESTPAGASVAGALPRISSPRPPIVLLVEDDAAARDVLAELLIDSGCDVISAESAADALTRAERLDQPAAVLMTDVCMPGLDGRELAKHLLARWPSMKILFISGLPATELADHRLPGARFLQKPFGLRQLVECVSGLLEER
jgi:CheY-like chemotaxis protein